MLYAIQSDEKLYNKILDDILNKQISLMQWDYDILGWGYTHQDLKNYFGHNMRLTKYLNKQIYPKYKNEIDKLLLQRQKKKEIQSITQIRDLKKVMQLIQKYNIQDQQLLKKLYQIHKSNDDLTLLKKLVDKIEDRQIKMKFEQSKLYQPSLFAKKKIVQIAKQLYKDYCNAYIIAKDVYSSASGYMNVVNKYVHQISQRVLGTLKDGKLTHNIYVKIRVNKNEIKAKEMQDFNFIFVQIYSPQIKNKQVKKIGIGCTDSFNIPSYAIKKPGVQQGEACYWDQNGNDSQANIHMGVDPNDFQNLWKDEYEETLQHQLIHVFELVYGYLNKKVDYSQDDEEYSQSFEYMDTDDDMDALNWKTQEYWANGTQFTPYIANLLSLFKRKHQQGVSSVQLAKKLSQVKFKDFEETNDLIEYLIGKDHISDAGIVWLYHVSQKDRKLFEYAKKKLINKILKF